MVFSSLRVLILFFLYAIFILYFINMVIRMKRFLLVLLILIIDGFSEDILSFIGTSKMFDILLAILAIPFLRFDSLFFLYYRN